MFKLDIRVDIGKECPGVADGQTSTKKVQSYGPWLMLENGFHSISLSFLYRFSSNFA